MILSKSITHLCFIVFDKGKGTTLIINIYLTKHHILTPIAAGASLSVQIVN